MVEYSDEEQVERIRAWWEQNGMSIIVAIVLGVAGLMGWQHWQKLEAQTAEAASVLYQEMILAVEQAQGSAMSAEQASIAEAKANSLIEEFPNESYADYARFLLARLAVEGSDFESAQGYLEAVTDSPASDVIGYTAKLRLARLYASQDNAEAALALANGSYPDSFAGQFLEIKGDILRGQGNVEAAAAAYNEAVELIDDPQFKELVKMKLDDMVPAS